MNCFWWEHRGVSWPCPGLIPGQIKGPVAVGKAGALSFGVGVPDMGTIVSYLGLPAFEGHPELSGM